MSTSGSHTKASTRGSMTARCATFANASRARLRRCARRINFFHGVAGKYDLDRPEGLPLGFEYYDHVAFINRDRMQRYLTAGIVTPRQAVLVGYPKLDRLVNGAYDRPDRPFPTAYDHPGTTRRLAATSSSL